MDPAEKDRIRRAMLERRAALPGDFQESAAQAIEDRLLARPEWGAASGVGLYWAARGEVSTRGIFRRLREEGHRVYLPRLGPEGLEFAEAPGEGDLVAGPWGILEPPAGLKSVPVGTLATILVPGVAFDRGGGRLGWGKGYYDRALRGYRGRRWALAYQFQVLDKVPMEERDEGVDLIFTESGTIEVGMPPGAPA